MVILERTFICNDEKIKSYLRYLIYGISTEIYSAQKHLKSLLHTTDCLLHRIITRNLMDSKQYWMNQSLNNVHSCQVLLTM